MTQEELGYVFGVKKATISNWENGYDIIPLNKLIKFCNLYDYSLDLLEKIKFILNLIKSIKLKLAKNLKI